MRQKREKECRRLALFSRCSGELCSPCVPNQPKLALFSRAAVAAVSSPPELKQRLALFFRHFWIKYFILNHIVALFPLKIAPFYAFLGSAVGDWLVN